MRMRTRWLVVPVLLAAAGPAAAQQGDWTTYGGNDWNQRYSPLKTINTSNVGQLVVRKMFQTGITKLGSFENTPIVTGGYSNDFLLPARSAALAGRSRNPDHATPAGYDTRSVWPVPFSPPCNVPAPDNGTRLDSHNH
jgi:hypothetical protein